MGEQNSNVFYRWVLTGNWLTRAPNPNAKSVILCCLFLIIMSSLIYWDNTFNWAQYMGANAIQVFQHFQYWRLWSTLLIHGDLNHLLSNLFLFVILGYFLAGYFGLLFFPLVAFISGGVINLIVLLNMAPEVNLIGLSGVVYWMGGAWLILYFLVESRKTILQKIIRTIGVFLTVFMPTSVFDPNVSYQAHFIGFLVGLLMGLVFYLLNQKKLHSAETYQLVIDEDL